MPIVRLIGREHRLACQTLWRTLNEKFHLRLHLGAIRDFLHFGRGDFAGALMESIAEPLSKAAPGLHRHALVSCLENALLLSVQDGVSPLVRDRLDVRLHDVSAAPGGGTKLVGWDIFTLDYRLDPEVSAILSPSSMAEHVRVSHFLWSLRRVLFTVTGWSRRVLVMRRQARLCGLASVLDADLLRMQSFLQEGAAFARQLYCFAQAGVSEAWGALFDSLDACSRLHRTMVDPEDADARDPSGNLDPKHTDPQACHDPRDCYGGIDWFVSLHESLIRGLRERLFIFSSDGVRTRLAVTLSALLRTESVSRALERYVNLCGEYVSRVQGGRRGVTWTVSPQDEHLLAPGADFASTQGRLMGDCRLSFQTLVKSFHAELDAFLLCLRKEACVGPPASRPQTAGTSESVARLLLLLDYGEYHARRPTAKYSISC